MIRNFIIILILITGLGLVKYQVFDGGQISKMFIQGATYERIKSDLDTLNKQLQKISSTLFSHKPAPIPDEITEPENPEPENQTTKNRETLNAENILYFTNLERTKRGLKPLKFNAKLTRSSNAKSRDMFTAQYFAHVSPFDTNKNFAYFIENQSYEFVRVSENLAMGDFTSAQQVVTAWMNSKDHRANILFPEYREIGASVQSGTLNGDTVVMIVQHFGIPKTVCPTVSQAMLSKIQSIETDAMISKKNAAKLEKDINEGQSKSLSTEALDDLIGVYNTTIRDYNKLVEEFETLSKEYNLQVQKYDDCIKGMN